MLRILNGKSSLSHPKVIRCHRVTPRALVGAKKVLDTSQVQDQNENQHLTVVCLNFDGPFQFWSSHPVVKDHRVRILPEEDIVQGEEDGTERH